MAPKRKVTKKTSSKSVQKSTSKTRGGASKKRSVSRNASAIRSHDKVTNFLEGWEMAAPPRQPRRRRSSSRTTIQRSRSVSRHKSVERRRSASRASSVASVRATKSKSKSKAAPKAKKRKALSTLEQGLRKVKPRSVLKDTMLPIEVLDKFSLLCGLKSPSILWYVAHQKAHEDEPEYIHPDYFQVVPPNVRFTQIHQIHNHYLVSHQNRDSVFIFDSINCSRHVADVMPQLVALYRKLQTSGVPEEYIKYAVSQEQGATVDCGLFAAANALMLHQNLQSPFNVTLDQEQMRPHLAMILEKNKVKAFPTIVNAGRSDSRAAIAACGDARRRTRLYSCDTVDEALGAMGARPALTSGAIPSVSGFQLMNEIFVGDLSVMGVAQMVVTFISFLFLCIYMKETIPPLLGYPSKSDDIG